METYERDLISHLITDHTVLWMVVNTVVLLVL